MTRNSEITRATSETSVECRLDLDGVGTSDVKTGLGFLDHMLTALAKHSRIDLTLLATGDTEVDDHHTVEDCAIALGRALNEALGERSGITRFGYSYAPLDESLSRAVVDLSGRPWPEIDLSLTRETINDVASENLTHFFRTLAMEARMALHVDVIRGDNDHHKAESAFKAVALALREAVVISSNEVPSTKGSLT
jgi:imidazoleglycerol phosphate dehydratase HisB